MIPAEQQKQDLFVVLDKAKNDWTIKHEDGRHYPKRLWTEMDWQQVNVKRHISGELQKLVDEEKRKRDAGP